MKKYVVLIFLICFSLQTATAVTVTTFDKAIWIPYWRKTEGASTTLQNLNTLTQISPFAFELQSDGSIKNALRLEAEPWTTLIAEAP